MSSIAASARSPLRMSLGSFKSTTSKFPSRSLAKPLTQALERFTSEQPPGDYILVQGISGASELTLNAKIAVRGPKFKIEFTVVANDQPAFNERLSYLLSNPRLGAAAAKRVAGALWASALKLEERRASGAADEPMAEVPVSPDATDGSTGTGTEPSSAEPESAAPSSDESIPEAEEEPDPFFRPSLRGYLRAFGVATHLDEDATLFGIAGLKPSPRAFFEANVQPQLKTRGDHFTLSGDISLYGSTTAPTGLLLINELSADAQYGPVRLLVGRKRIVWGQGLAVNPTDIVNPLKDPLLPELQRTGALLLPMIDVSVGPFIFTGLISMGIETDTWAIPVKLKPKNSIYVLRAYALFEGFDFNLMYYRDQNRQQNLFGTAVSRFIGDWVELHVEALARAGAPETLQLPSTPSCGAATEELPGSWTLTALAGTRVHFEDQSVLVAEYFYNGNGLDASRYDQLAVQAPCLRATLAAIGGPMAPGAPEHPVGFPSEQLFAPRTHHVFLNYERPHLTADLFRDVSVMAGALVSPADLSAVFQLGLGYSFSGRTLLNLRVMYWAGKNGTEAGDWPARVLGMAVLKVAL